MVPERDPAATALNGLLPLRREYTQAWHGFDRNEVRQYLDHVEAQLRRVLSERDAAVAQAAAAAREAETIRQQVASLEARVEELKKPSAAYVVSAEEADVMAVRAHVVISGLGD